MRHKSVLLGSVSLAALASVAAAHAQDSADIPEGFTLSLEGGFSFGPNTAAEDKLGSGGEFMGSGLSGGGVVDIGDNIGYRAAVALGKQIDPMWDIAVGASINRQLETTSTLSGGYSVSGGSGGTVEYGEQIATAFNYENGDFTVGYRPQLDSNLDIRLFGGARALHYTDSTDKLGFENFDSNGSGTDGSITFDATSVYEFLGAGPRVGVEGSTRLGDSMFGVSAMASAAAIYGLERSSSEGTVFVDFGSGSSGGIIPIPDSEEWKWVYNIEGSLGLDMYVAEDAKLTLGVHAEQVFNVGNGDDEDDKNSRLNYGPTLKFEAKF
jgi:hypothetical protein